MTKIAIFRLPRIHLRNFLRPFRGVNKVYLQQYVAMHEWAHNIKEVTVSFLRILCGVTQFAP